MIFAPVNHMDILEGAVSLYISYMAGSCLFYSPNPKGGYHGNPQGGPLGKFSSIFFL